MPEIPSKTDSGWFTDANQLTSQQGLGGRSNDSLIRAKALVERFKTGTAQEFRTLSRATVANDLDFKLRFPDAFRQGKSPFCGIAIFVRDWAYDNPEAFVRLAIDLFEKGRGKLESAGKHSGQVLMPSLELKTSLAQFDMAQADWLVMASIREGLNNDFNYVHYTTINQMTGGTTKERVEREFRTAGYSRVVSGDSLIEASSYYEKNWRVVLHILPWLLTKNEQQALKERNLSGTSHYIGLDSEVVFTNYGGNSLVQPFNVWTWGGRSKLPAWEKAIPFDAIKPRFFYSAAKW